MQPVNDLLSLPLIFLILALSGAAFFIYSSLTGPLAHLPGPFYTKFTGVVHFINIFRGKRHVYLTSLHAKYGPTVRINPREVSVVDSGSVKQVFKTFLKPVFYENLTAEPTPSVFTTTDPVYHAKLRKLLAGGMSESSLKSLQPVVQSKVNLLMSGLKKERDTKGYMDLYKWNHFYATDVIAELAFGQSFKTLEDGKDHQYVKDIQALVPYNILRVTVTGRPHKETKDWPIWPFTAMEKINVRLLDHAQNALNRYRHHLAQSDNPRPNFFDKIMGEKGHEAAITEDELVSNAKLYLVAGTDTLALPLTYLFYALLESPRVRARLLQDIKLAELPQQPTNDQLRAVTYLDCVIDESLRLYPPIVGPLPRVVPEGGRMLGNCFVPQGITANPFTYLLQRNPDIFPDPETWNPDRWESATKEMKEAMWPFGGGSRICMGRFLARMEMRMAVVAFLQTFETAEVAYGVEDFAPKDMEVVDTILGKPVAEKLLVR
ncbi:cytochrome P450 [Penicillium longicatenatum]|uniref:cytochrome P450 n=1 Tax=Penicillium longicatenatum TaxID=1561947 RepID=UPI0025468E22|nr:cytochrome P450 [Penicillium longicatenatum]KAJ5635543.1 cytochrome P450 [Penicillium longicatenatum]